MRVSDIVGLLWFIGIAMGMPGLRRRQAQGSTDSCTCPSGGLVTVTVVQSTIFTSSTTVTTEGSSTVFSTTSAVTESVTISSSATITVITGTTTIIRPGVTRTTTALSSSTITITETVSQTTCIRAVPRMIKRQNTDNSLTESDSVTTTIDSQPVICKCRLRPSTTTLAGTSTCQCPATTTTTVTVSSFASSTVVETVITETPVIVVITPTELYTTTVSTTFTSSSLATEETTQSSLTVTSQSVATSSTTVTSTITVNSCPATTSSSSTTTSQSSTSSSISPVPSSPGSLRCNSTAYLVSTVNQVTNLYNIDLATGQTIIFARNVGSGTYTTINGMGFNTLDNFLYGIATISAGNYAVVRLSITGTVQQILAFSASANPGSVGDFDLNGQFYFSGGGTNWYQVDLAPGSSTYGTIVNSGTSTLTGYTLLDWSYLGGQGNYMWAIGRSTDSTPRFGLLRWSLDNHVWSVFQAYPTSTASESIIATWGGNNGTIWGLAATSGKIERISVGGNPVALSTGPTGLTSGDGARCALA